MNFGFRIVYHKSIEPSRWLFEFLEEQYGQFSSKNSYKCRSESGAFFRRGKFGLGLDHQYSTSGEIIYTFRRLSNNRRIFGVVPVGLLVMEDDTEIKLKQCMCGEHRGGQQVRLRDGLNDIDWITYKEF